MKKVLSLLRTLEYQEISKLKINGKILDLGGDRRSGYHELLKGNHKIEVVNIKKECGTDFNFDIEKKFPLENESYEAVLCLNVLEHIFNYRNVLSESYRILKKEGSFIGATPFLFNVHGSPDDYFRYTKSALERMFKESGFKEIWVKELGTGLFSLLYQLKFGIYRPEIVRLILRKIYLLLDKILIHQILKSIRPEHHLSEKHLPLGYFFVARK